MTQSKGVRKHYTDQQRADAIAMYDATLSHTAVGRKMGLSAKVVQRIVRNRTQVPVDIREESKGDLLGALDRARWKYLSRLTEDAVVNKESGYYASQSFKILNEQHQLLSGGPTARFSLADYLRGALKESVEGEFNEIKEIGASNGQHASSKEPNQPGSDKP